MCDGCLESLDVLWLGLEVFDLAAALVLRPVSLLSCKLCACSCLDMSSLLLIALSLGILGILSMGTFPTQYSIYIKKQD